MSRDNVVYLVCGLLLGLIIGSLVIGPGVARSKLAGPPPVTAEAAAVAAPATDSMAQTAGAAQSNPMQAVRQQIDALKATIEREPGNVEALAQLGNMYMDAGKFPQAAGYYERALRLREDPNLRTDLGICYKESGQLEPALAAFRKVAEEKPDQWQAVFNEAVVLGELKRFDEARVAAAKLARLRPDDPEVKKLNQALTEAR